MKQINSIGEFDLFIAAQAARGKFVKLDYGLIPPDNAWLGAKEKNDPWRAVAAKRQNIKSTPIMSIITIGSFLVSN